MPASDTVEREVRALCDAGDHEAAATAALRGYGPELYSFLAALHPVEADAADVFSEVSIKLWRGLPRFAWQSSLRTWAYTIARNTSVTVRSRGRAALSLDTGVAADLAVQIRTATHSYLRTAAKNKFAELRAALPIADQELLILRVDRGLEWNELAQTLSDRELDAAETKREAARLRKRFQTLKERLFEAGRAAGLVG